MIEQGQGTEPPEEDNVQDKDKKPRRRSFLLSWLEARESGTSKETAEEESEKPRKGFSALLRRFFERDVSMEPVEETEKGIKKSENILDWWPSIEKVEEEDNVDEEEELFLPATDTKSAALEPSIEMNTPTSQLPAARELEEQVRIMHQIDSAAPRPEATSVSGKLETKESEPKTVIDKRESLAALTLVGLGAEYLGRKKQGRTQEKRIGKLEGKSAAQDRKIERQESELLKRTIHAETYEPRESLAIHREVEAKPEPITAEKKHSPEDEAIAALPREKIAEEVAKKVERYEKQQEAPTSVLREMVKAAEANAPVERIYERRQEVRDEAGGSYSYGAPVPVASIIRSMSGNLRNSSHSPVPGAPSSNNQNIDHNSQIYKQAAQRGFWSAVVIVIFALMVYLFI